jgi:glycosyltransferase involved in cell wall biosynthesis
MKILMITDACVKREGRVQRCYEALCEKYEVFLIDASPHQEDTAHDPYNNITIYTPNRRGIARLFLLEREIGRIAKTHDFDVIYALNFYMANIGRKTAKKYKKPFVYDAFELNYHVRGQRMSPRKRIFYHLERNAILACDLLICASRDRALLMMGHYKLSALPTYVMNISATSGAYEPSAAGGKQLPHGKLDVVYAGNLEADRGLLTLIDSFESNRLNNSYNLHIYGSGAMLDLLKAKAADPACDYLFVHGPYQNHDLNALLMNHHIGFISYPNDTPNNVFCCPNKIYDYARAGLPVAASFNEGLRYLLEKGGIGVCGDDLTAVLKDITANYRKYAENSTIFSRDNNWEKEKRRLYDALDYIERRIGR